MRGELGYAVEAGCGALCLCNASILHAAALDSFATRPALAIGDTVTVTTLGSTAEVKEPKPPISAVLRPVTPAAGTLWMKVRPGASLLHFDVVVVGGGGGCCC